MDNLLYVALISRVLDRSLSKSRSSFTPSHSSVALRALISPRSSASDMARHFPVMPWQILELLEAHLRSNLWWCIWRRDLVPLGQSKSNFNFNLDEKRVLNFENEVSDSDNIKQDMSIDVYGRQEEEPAESQPPPAPPTNEVMTTRTEAFGRSNLDIKIVGQRIVCGLQQRPDFSHQSVSWRFLNSCKEENNYLEWCLPSAILHYLKMAGDENTRFFNTITKVLRRIKNEHSLLCRLLPRKKMQVI